VSTSRFWHSSDALNVSMLVSFSQLMEASADILRVLEDASKEEHQEFLEDSLADVGRGSGGGGSGSAAAGADDSGGDISRRPSFQAIRNVSSTKELVSVLRREGASEASHVVITGSELLHTIAPVLGMKQHKATKADIEARTQYLSQGMLRTPYAHRKSVSEGAERALSASFCAFVQNGILTSLCHQDSVMNAIYNPQSRSQQASCDAEMGRQGQDRRLFIFTSVSSVSVVLPSVSSSAQLASQSSSGAALSPARPAASQRQQPHHRPARALMGAEEPFALSEDGAYCRLTPDVCAKVHTALVYAWQKVPEQGTKPPMFATKANAEAVKAGDDWLEGILKPAVMDPADKLVDEAILTCVQSIAQEFNQKLTFIAEMHVHVLDLIYRAPNLESYLSVIEMCNSLDWWHKLTKWTIKLHCVDLHFLSVSIKNREQEPK